MYCKREVTWKDQEACFVGTLGQRYKLGDHEMTQGLKRLKSWKKKKQLEML